MKIAGWAILTYVMLLGGAILTFGLPETPKGLPLYLIAAPPLLIAGSVCGELLFEPLSGSIVIRVLKRAGLALGFILVLAVAWIILSV